MKIPSEKLLKELANKGGTHDIGDLQITFHFTRDSKRLDSFWFHGHNIIEVSYKDRFVIADSQGDMAVTFTENDDYHFSGDNAVGEAHRRKYTDKHINKIGQHDGWRNNNWIELEFGLIINSETRKEILGMKELWRDRMSDFIKVSKLSHEEFQKAFYSRLWLEETILDTYDEALSSAVSLVLDEDFWSEQNGELINEAIISLEL